MSICGHGWYATINLCTERQWQVSDEELEQWALIERWLWSGMPTIYFSHDHGYTYVDLICTGTTLPCYMRFEYQHLIAESSSCQPFPKM